MTLISRISNLFGKRVRFTASALEMFGFPNVSVRVLRELSSAGSVGKDLVELLMPDGETHLINKHWTIPMKGWLIERACYTKEALDFFHREDEVLTVIRKSPFTGSGNKKMTVIVEVERQDGSRMHINQYWLRASPFKYRLGI